MALHTKLGLPAKLTTGDALVNTDEALAGADYVMMYFSAHWVSSVSREAFGTGRGESLRRTAS